MRDRDSWKRLGIMFADLEEKGQYFVKNPYRKDKITADECSSLIAALLAISELFQAFQ